MKIICPKCQSEISNRDVNVSADLAFCDKCSNLFKLSELLNTNIDLSKKESVSNNILDLPVYESKLKKKQNNTIDLTNPPSGVWIKKYNDGFEVGATTRSPLAFFLVPFMFVWSGGSIGGIYGSQIISGKFNLFMSLFGIPFLIGTIIFGSIALMFTFGKVCVRVDGNQGVIFTGVGTTGMQKFFNVDEIASIREEGRNFQNGGTILMEGKQRHIFGSFINSERKYFFIRALKELMKK